MKVTILSAVRAQKGFEKGQGLSVMIRTGDRCLLYGFGGDDAALHNMEKLHISADGADTGFLASALPCDAGGLVPFMTANRRAALYVRLNALDDRWKKGLLGYKKISPDDRLRKVRRVVRCKNYFVDKDETFLTFSLSSADASPVPGAPKNFVRGEDGAKTEDDFTHEMYLLVRGENKSWTLFCGQAYAGLGAIVRHAARLIERNFGGALACVVSGIALPAQRDKGEAEKYVADAAQAIADAGATLYAGIPEKEKAAADRFAAALGARFCTVAAGDVLEF